MKRPYCGIPFGALFSIVLLVGCHPSGPAFAPPPETEDQLAGSPGPINVHSGPFFQFKGGKSGGNTPISNVGGTALIGDPQRAFFSVTDGGGLDKCRRKYYKPGCGVVYKLTPTHRIAYEETVLHQFDNTDGGVPEAALVEDGAGNLFGTTSIGGKYHDGTVFELARTGSTYRETVLHSFEGGDDGAAPTSPLIFGKGGVLYGTTSGSLIENCNGVKACGTVFRIDSSGAHYKVLYVFKNGGAAGWNPSSAVVMDGKGALFGTTAGNCCGTVYELAPTGSGSYEERTLHAFRGTDGAMPNGGLLDESGTLYGVTYFGGTGGCKTFHYYFPPGCGTIFKLTPNGSRNFSESVIHDFTIADLAGGISPYAGLTLGQGGFFYGTASGGGNTTGECYSSSPYGYFPGGCGVVYRIRPDGSDYRVLLRFEQEKGGEFPEGAYPNSRLLAVDGTLYGTTPFGGRYDFGAAFKIVL